MHLSLARCPDGSAYKYRRIIVLFRWNISFGGSQSCQFIHLRSGTSIAVSDQFITLLPVLHIYYLYYITARSRKLKRTPIDLFVSI